MAAGLPITTMSRRHRSDLGYWLMHNGDHQRADRPSERSVEQRTRNRVMEYLAFAASFEDQRKYEAVAPMAHIPYEVINQWEDHFPRGLEWDLACPREFTRQEVEALQRFEGVWRTTSDAVPYDYSSLYDVQALPKWLQLQMAASTALAVLEQRGRTPEDFEALDR